MHSRAAESVNNGQRLRHFERRAGVICIGFWLDAACSLRRTFAGLRRSAEIDERLTTARRRVKTNTGDNRGFVYHLHLRLP